MELMDAIRNRRSIRDYLPRPVPRELLWEVLEAGRLAPSARNQQEWRYIVVEDQVRRERLMAAASYQTFIVAAPVVLVACAETDARYMQCGQLAYPIDVAISIDHLTLKAVEAGLGTCWIGAFDEVKVKELLNIPPQIRVVELITLGYPANIPKPRPRKNLAEIVRFEKWE